MELETAAAPAEEETAKKPASDGVASDPKLCCSPAADVLPSFPQLGLRDSGRVSETSSNKDVAAKGISSEVERHDSNPGMARGDCGFCV